MFTKKWYYRNLSALLWTLVIFNFHVGIHEADASPVTQTPSESVARCYDYECYRDYYSEDVVQYGSDCMYDHPSFFGPIVLIAATTFGLLVFALILQLLGVQISRSLNSNPAAPWDENVLQELILKAVEWFETPSAVSPGNLKESGRFKRSREVATKGIRVGDWIRAYKKDPDSYSCLRRLACETLANSTLAEQSVKSALGGTIMSVLGRAMEHGSEVMNLVTEVVGDPDKCEYIASDTCA